MSYEHLRYEVDGHVGILTLNRPDRLNAMNRRMQEELLEAIDDVHGDDEVRVLVVTGAGRGFCSGADVTGPVPAAAAQPSQNEMLDEHGWVGRQALALYGLDKPVIAAVNGVAAGAGMSLALAADMRVGSDKARFKTVFIERNLSPDSGMSFFLPRIVGYSRATDLIYTSRAVGADEAFRMGLLDRLVPEAELLPAAIALANEMTQWPPVALRSSKRVLQNSMEHDLEESLRYELYGLSFGRKATNDGKESRAALLEKRAEVHRDVRAGHLGPGARGLLRRAATALVPCLLAGCATQGLEHKPPVGTPASEASAAALADLTANEAALALALTGLDARVDVVEARRAASTAYATVHELAARYRMVSPALLHNTLVNAGLRDRGLCCHWAEDTVARLHSLQLATLEVHWVTAHLGDRLREHNSAMLSPRGGGLANGIVIDGWRDAGRIYWGAADSDRYPWRLHPASREWQRVRCE